jgi:hypothetical protein
MQDRREFPLMNRARKIEEALNPAAFAVGSAASRAAARMIVLQREKSVRRITWINDSVPRPRQDPTRAHSSGWQKQDDGSLFRWVTVPPGMDVKYALAQLDGLNG